MVLHDKIMMTTTGMFRPTEIVIVYHVCFLSAHFFSSHFLSIGEWNDNKIPNEVQSFRQHIREMSVKTLRASWLSTRILYYQQDDKSHSTYLKIDTNYHVLGMSNKHLRSLTFGFTTYAKINISHSSFKTGIIWIKVKFCTEITAVDNTISIRLNTTWWTAIQR